MEKPQNETGKTSGHKYILNKTKFVLTTVIGAFCAIGGALTGFYMAGGHMMILLHWAEIVMMLSITIGALFFSYGSTAFKPWLGPLGVGVPEQEEVIKNTLKFADQHHQYC